MDSERHPNAELFLPINTTTHGFSNAVVRLFHTADRTAFADIVMDGRRRCLEVRSNEFRQWIELDAYKATGKSPPRQ
jgi:hypothetical protein